MKFLQHFLLYSFSFAYRKPITLGHHIPWSWLAHSNLFWKSEQNWCSHSEEQDAKNVFSMLNLFSDSWLWIQPILEQMDEN